MLQPGLAAVAVMSQKVVIVSPRFVNRFGDPAEHRQISANVRLDVLIGNGRAKQQAVGVAGYFEIYQSDLTYRVYDNDFSAALFDVHQGRH